MTKREKSYHNKKKLFGSRYCTCGHCGKRVLRGIVRMAEHWNNECFNKGKMEQLLSRYQLFKDKGLSFGLNGIFEIYNH